MNFTVYPYKPMCINKNEINVYATKNVSLYTQLISDLINKSDELKFSDDNLKSVSLSKAYAFLGDLLIDVDLDKLFLNKIYKQLEDGLDDVQKTHVQDTIRQLMSDMQMIGYNVDVSLNVDDFVKLQKVMKLCNLSFDNSSINTPMEKLENIIKSYTELGNDKLIVFVNLISYMKKDDYDCINELLKDHNQQILDIEFTSLEYLKKLNINYKFIDEDFCEW